MRSGVSSLVLLIALAFAPARAEEADDIAPAHRQAVSRAAVALAFAHGCATFVAAPRLVDDAMDLLQAAYAAAGDADPLARTLDAYWTIVNLVEDGAFAADGTFDRSVCDEVENRIARARKALE